MKRAAVLVALFACACQAPTQEVRDTGLDGLRLDGADPGLLVPGSTIVLRGASFVDVDLGASRLLFDGTLAGTPLQFSLPATFVSTSRMTVAVNAAFITAVGGNLSGNLSGNFTIEVRSTVDNAAHDSGPLATSLQLTPHATPTLLKVNDGITFVNQPIEIDGDDFLLGGNEGTLQIRVMGCFTPVGDATCVPNIDVLVPGASISEFDRSRAVFPYATSISGIGPGHFAGQVLVMNEHQDGNSPTSAPIQVNFDVQPPLIAGASTTSASLGQYVMISGGGFVGGADDESTIVTLVGTYTDSASGMVTPLNVVLVPQFISGPQLRYVLDETDALGQKVDLRKSSGTITGTVAPTVQKGSATLTSRRDPRAAVDPAGEASHLSQLREQLHPEPASSSGSTAADDVIRARAIALSQVIVASLNVEFRDVEPTDFALYSVVDISGPDPNGQGLYGYDNTPGKDVGNLRLYDHIGGVNATTQADGDPGYGGIFVESFFSFSAHPNGLAMPAMVEPMFDAMFDPFRPDAGGNGFTATEARRLATGRRSTTAIRAQRKPAIAACRSPARCGRSAT